jgi:hypothetical protein
MQETLAAVSHPGLQPMMLEGNLSHRVLKACCKAHGLLLVRDARGPPESTMTGASLSAPKVHRHGVACTLFSFTV